MFEKSDDFLKNKGALITVREVQQQPQLWSEVIDDFIVRKNLIKKFFNKMKAFSKIRVIFAGAGSSAFVGNAALPYLMKNGNRANFNFESIDTTKIVSTPESYLFKDEPTLLVSFARSGNSPESVATVKLAKKIIDNLYQITITCSSDGKLAEFAQNDDNNLLLLQPTKSNDKGFAMTGSYSCMLLTTLLIFDERHSLDEKKQYVKMISQMGNEVIERNGEIKNWLSTDIQRIIYLGSGCLGGLTQEAQLKILELTAGKKATLFETSMGFRHGPKSFINDKSIVIDFISNNIYTSQYDLDILNEVKNDQIANKIIGIGSNDCYQGDKFIFKKGSINLPDGYQMLPDLMVAQTLAVEASLKVGNTPDTPSHNGTVNRVVKGVTIHNYKKGDKDVDDN